MEPHASLNGSVFVSPGAEGTAFREQQRARLGVLATDLEVVSSYLLLSWRRSMEFPHKPNSSDTSKFKSSWRNFPFWLQLFRVPTDPIYQRTDWQYLSLSSELKYSELSHPFIIKTQQLLLWQPSLVQNKKKSKTVAAANIRACVARKKWDSMSESLKKKKYLP